MAVLLCQYVFLLQISADKIVDPDPDIILGHNRGTYDDQGCCDWFGFGKLVVAEAKRRRNA